MLTAEISLSGKAVIAIEITCVGNQQTEGLDDSIAFFQVKCPVGKCLFGKKLPLFDEFINVVEAVLNIFCSYTLIGKFIQKCSADLFPAELTLGLIDETYCLISQLIRHVDAAAVDIQDDVIIIENILMNHELLLPFTWNEPCARRVHGPSYTSYERYGRNMRPDLPALQPPIRHFLPNN